MKRICLVLCLMMIVGTVAAQEIRMVETASLAQVYGEAWESAELLPMNDIGVDSGYVLYQTEVEVPKDGAVLEVENVRDYAAVYLGGKLQGAMTNTRKVLPFNAEPGTYALQLYVENIGRITYGPEILDNSKGLFGSAALDGEELEDWTIIPLNVRGLDFDKLEFGTDAIKGQPAFHLGSFDVDTAGDTYLDMSGWGMGEVWINGDYLGSFWEEEKQQSILVPVGVLTENGNRIVIFEIKDNGTDTVKLSDKPVFK